jgi:hypothetical protein
MRRDPLRMLRHLAGYVLVASLVFRESIDLWTGVFCALVVLVFELPGVGRLYELAKRWIGKNDTCDPR